MPDRADPPEGVPPGGGDDEFGTTVFDEAFVRRAPLEECSARERLEDHRHPVRRRPERLRSGSPGSLVRHGAVLVALVVLVFAVAVHLGVAGTYPEPPRDSGRAPLATVVPLAPGGPVPGGDPARLLARSPAAGFRTGASGVDVPAPLATRDFTRSQVLAALSLAKGYVVASSVDPRVLTGDATGPVRELLVEAQQPHFDRALRQPPGALDADTPPGTQPGASAWLVRFDPGRVALAGEGVRVDGGLEVAQQGRDALEVTADHVLVYPLRAAGNADGGAAGDAAGHAASGRGEASLFTVRRLVRFHFDRQALLDQRVRVEHVVVRAGPLPCAADTGDRLRPLLAGEHPGKDGVASDPYAAGPAGARVCGVLADPAAPGPPAD
ncbi:hypothetical protein V1J52_09385 [Streptomyces sp. TRM 70351]|uniref:SCO2583 family membrane protein n=1 Tax=Streptomyces sp. TRM 70351 TaxID=3116552 RepID=UPI002E7BA9A4|nr:hypothetical protein [Streptomyces sp. TRM 70351]MEE1928403.1 hypothetical protein [Streptomyces sp. TRM 70351]